MAHQFDTPAFKNEQEEAAWWDSHEDEVIAAFEKAAESGTLGRGTLMREGGKAFESLANESSTKQGDSKRKSAA